MINNVTDHKEKSRYELAVGEHVTIADYRIVGTQISITHVFTPPELRGQGVAAKLMEAIVADTKARGLTIVPVCPYAASYLKKNPV